MTTEQIIAACDLQWQNVGNLHAACRWCGFVVHVACDATIEDHMNECGPLSEKVARALTAKGGAKRVANALLKFADEGKGGTNGDG